MRSVSYPFIWLVNQLGVLIAIATKATPFVMGIVISVRAMHPEKALIPIFLTPFGRETFVNAVQSSNALEPIKVTLLGIVSSVREVHLEKVL